MISNFKGMMASPRMTLLLLLSMTAGLPGQADTVTQADEDRAISSIMQLLRREPGPISNIQNVRFFF